MELEGESVGHPQGAMLGREPGHDKLWAALQRQQLGNLLTALRRSLSSAGLWPTKGKVFWQHLFSLDFARLLSF